LQAVRLSTIEVGQSAKILCISEVVEDEEALIMYLHEKGLTPEIVVTVLSQGTPDPETHALQVILEVNGREVVISREVATKIWVTR
jgi:DtxR family Mn-dependent transcriptional regulator